MSLVIKIALIAGVGAYISAQASTPAQLVTAFRNMLPTGQKAVMAWAMKDGGIYVVDSDTGVFHKLPTTNASSPQITEDHNRVVWQDKGSGKLHVINWDGTGDRVFYANGGCWLSDYYYDATTEIEYAVTNNSFQKIDIATGKATGLPGNGDDGYKVSPDGKYVAADFSGNSSSFGICNVATGQKTMGFTCGTCNCNIAPDLTYRLMVQYSLHNEVCVNSPPGIGTGTGPNYNGTNRKDLVSAILKVNPQDQANPCTGKSAGYGFESTNWVAPDYVAFIMTNSIQNPYLVKLSDPTKWVAVMDSSRCDIDQEFMTTAPDAKIFDRPTGVGHEMRHAKIHSIGSFASANREWFFPTGRKTNSANWKSNRTGDSAPRGIVIRREAFAAMVRMSLHAR